jgi:hypothetical protein
METENEPSGERADDDEDSEDLEYERPKLSLKAAIVWIGTRDPERTRQIEADDWQTTLDESTFKFASNGADAWMQLRRHLAAGTISATGISYLVPDGFDPSEGGWSTRGGGFQRRIDPDQFSGLEPVTHTLAPYSALRPSGVILTGAKWYRDVYVDLTELQTTFPQKKKRNRESLKMDAARRAYAKVYPTHESREGTTQEERLENLNKFLKEELRKPSLQSVSLNTLKDIEKKLRGA